VRDDQVRRYARHILLHEIGGVGQKRLLAATAVVRDAAGAGAAALVYLAAAGVGTIALLDESCVRPEDVGFLYEARDVGRRRREAARERIAALNPDVTVAVEGSGRPVQVSGGGDAVDALLLGARAAESWIREVAGDDERH
jgi:adenylyltransferase/sulfurtransferase